MKRRIKHILKISHLFLAGMVTGLLVCEVIVRLLAPQRLDTHLAGLYVPDDDLVFGLNRNFSDVHSSFEFEVLVETNGIGLRDREIETKEPGVFRMLGLGDSFSFANGATLEETYFKQLELCLNMNSPGPLLEVINAAVPAYSILQELRYLEKHGMTLDPDGVLLGFHVGNDFVDSYELYNEDGGATIYVEDGLLYSIRGFDADAGNLRRISAPLRRWLQTRSHFYVLFRNRSSELLARAGLGAPIPPPDFCARKFTPQMQRGWEHTQELLRQLASFTRGLGVSLHIVILPTVYQVYERYWYNYVEINKLDAALYELDKPQQILAGFCAENNIPCIDVLPVMRARSSEAELFYKVDSHMSPAGHRVVADSLCAFFSVQGLDALRTNE